MRQIIVQNNKMAKEQICFNKIYIKKTLINKSVQTISLSFKSLKSKFACFQGQTGAAMQIQEIENNFEQKSAALQPKTKFISQRLQQIKYLQFYKSIMVDRQHRPGGKTGSGGVASYEDANVQRRQRLKKLVRETIDISKDPYFMRNHIGTYECRLCLTLHSNEGSYLAHTQGKKHQTNLARRAAREARDSIINPQKKNQAPKVRTVKIGKPLYRFKKQVDEKSGQKQIMFEIEYPQIEPGSKPQFRFMSAFEQRIEAPDKNFQFILFAGEPYVTIAFKIPNMELDKSEGKFYESWDSDRKIYIMLLSYKNQNVIETQ